MHMVGLVWKGPELVVQEGHDLGREEHKGHL